MRRLQAKFILKDLEKKMVLLVGPRQVGKTWLAREIGNSIPNSVYLNYDNRADRDIVLHERWPANTKLLILDEIHKMPDWQSFIKGVFDTRRPGMRMLITGSARMDLLSHSGESLAGRFFRHQLFPLSPAEAAGTPYVETIDRFMDRGGFPEPFLADDEVDAARWRSQYLDSMLRYDILDFQRIVDFRALQLTMSILRQRVGSPISFSSIARDVGVASATIAKYVNLLEGMFLLFRVTPFARDIARSLLKEPKIYFFDTALVEGDRGVRFENLVAVSLLKHISGLNDYRGEKWRLHYLRTKEGKETDFALVRDDRIQQIIECKLSDCRPDKNLVYFSQKYSLSATQLVCNTRHDQQFENIEIRKADDWLAGLFL